MKRSLFYSKLTNRLCFFLFVYIIIPKYITFSVGPIELSADRVVFVFLLLYFLYGVFSFSKVKKLLLKRIYSFKGITFLLVIFFILEGVSIYVSSDFGYSLKRFSYFFLYNLGLFFIGLTLPLDHKIFKKIALTILGASLFVVFFAFLELINNSNPFVPLLNSEGLNEYQKQILEEKIRGNSRRIQSSFSNTLGFAQYVVLIIPILLYFKRTVLKRSYIVNITVLLLSFTAVMTKSRAVIVILVMCFLYYLSSFVFNYKNRVDKKIGVLIVISFFAILLFAQFDFSIITDFLGGKEVLSDSNRLEQLTLASPLIFKSLLTGFGFGMGVEALGFGSLNSRGTIDNYLLTVILDAGIIALIVYVIIILKIIIKFFKVNSKVKIGWVGLMFFIVNLFSLSITEIHPLFYFFLAILLIKNQENETFNSSYSNQLQWL
jgi:hypothetical protein